MSLEAGYLVEQFDLNIFTKAVDYIKNNCANIYPGSIPSFMTSPTTASVRVAGRRRSAVTVKKTITPEKITIYTIDQVRKDLEDYILKADVNNDLISVGEIAISDRVLRQYNIINYFLNTRISYIIGTDVSKARPYEEKTFLIYDKVDKPYENQQGIKSVINEYVLTNLNQSVKLQGLSW